MDYLCAMPTVTCVRCSRTNSQMPFRPFPNDLGLKVFQEICGDCWGEWLKHQQALINHYALNVQDPKAKEFLFASMERYLFEDDDGLPTA